MYWRTTHIHTPFYTFIWKCEWMNSAAPPHAYTQRKERTEESMKEWNVFWRICRCSGHIFRFDDKWMSSIWWICIKTEFDFFSFARALSLSLLFMFITLISSYDTDWWWVRPLFFPLTYLFSFDSKNIICWCFLSSFFLNFFIMFILFSVRVARGLLFVLPKFWDSHDLSLVCAVHVPHTASITRE